MIRVERKSNFKKKYFHWLCDFTGDWASYKLLLKRLHTTPFLYVLDRDENRAKDGIDLRYRFGRENDVTKAEIERYFSNAPCGVLEMMVALALRCEEHIMANSNLGDRTSRWFWAMIASLGLSLQMDTNYSQKKIDDVLNDFLSREYAPNGEGGLFTVHGNRLDLRNVEIWYQAMWYLEEVLKQGGN